MQEIINYTIAIFKLLVTPYGIVAFLILLGLYAAYLFIFEKTNITIPTVVKLIAYPFMVTYGTLMLVLADLLEKVTVQMVGFFIMLLPVIITVVVFFIKEKREK